MSKGRVAEAKTARGIRGLPAKPLADKQAEGVKGGESWLEAIARAMAEIARGKGSR